MMCVLGLSGTTESSWASSLDHSLTVANWFESAGFFLFFFLLLLLFLSDFSTSTLQLRQNTEPQTKKM